MPFIASNGLTEAGTSKTIAAGGMAVHYHYVGEGEPVLFLHSYGPGTTAWITFHKTVGELSQHFRCILMDLPNFSRTGPIALGRQLAGRTVGDGGGHHLPRAGRQVRDGRFAHRHRW
jgi:pimeloyl-ACP methyl ester carboxylesterase